jgi:outer membrane lipoprotein SlyB
MFCRLLVFSTLSLLVMLSGCASSLSGSGYSRSQARAEQSVRLGTVESVREVEIDGTRSGVGSVAGGVVGGIAASSVGSGKGSQVAAVLGAVAGGIVGNAAEQAATRKRGLEITVKLQDGQLIAVTQEADEVFKVGENVRVVSGSGVTRVSH